MVVRAGVLACLPVVLSVWGAAGKCLRPGGIGQTAAVWAEVVSGFELWENLSSGLRLLEGVLQP